MTSSQNAAFGEASLARSAIRRQILHVVLTSKDFQSVLKEASAEIRECARPGSTEATIEGCFERVLYAVLRDAGIKFHPEKEVYLDLRRHLARGRTDSRLGALVIEYKRPDLLRTDGQIRDSLSQLKDYLSALIDKSEGPLVGLLTNGLVIYEIHAQKTGISTPTSSPLDEKALLRVIKLVVSLTQAALTPANLIRDFCGTSNSGIIFDTARVLEGILQRSQSTKTQMLRLEWEEMFRLAHDDQSQQKRIEERRAALGALFNRQIKDTDSEYRSLFALHTAYAILLKFVAYRVVPDVYFRSVPQTFADIASSKPTELRAFCDDLEDGEIFRILGFVNLLEGDFFSWYSDKTQWTSELSDSISVVLRTLARYEEARNIFDSGEVHDLFRELYEATVPRAVRSSFGEFYTPYWLADRVLDSAIQGDSWNSIDPCCGSGTFLVAAITRIRKERKDLEGQALLEQIVNRVTGIDLNPLGVLTSRIHYFIHISDLLHEPGKSENGFVIPVFLGDAASIPERTLVGSVPSIVCRLKTLKLPIVAVLPVSLAENTATFMRTMREYEDYIKAKNVYEASKFLFGRIPKTHQTAAVLSEVESCTAKLVELEINGWNGIWARILSNFFTTACLGRFDAVIGNPPWIDWKNLPAGYRERVKKMCIDRGLFSGAGRTGGINLNICALISYVALVNFLGDDGRLAFLMPSELSNQASYEGWRKLGSASWTFRQFHDWSEAGHPFDPVKEDFMTFVIGRSSRPAARVPVVRYKKAKRTSRAKSWKNWEDAKANLEISGAIAGQIIPGSTTYTFAENNTQLGEFASVAGESDYVGREGIEFYPQELLLFTYEAPGPQAGTVWLRNVQVAKSKYKIPNRKTLLETRYLHPLVKGPAIDRFRHNYDGLIVAFPYDAQDPRKPVAEAKLRESSKMLFEYYRKNRETIDQQTKFSDKIRGKDAGDFYGLARTGAYSFAETYVAFRDNSKWCATVIQKSRMPWGERKRFVFQNHAVSICEKEGVKGFITESEAHFVCAILNAPIAGRFIAASSDERSYKIRPPLYIPTFDPGNPTHVSLSELSRKAHSNVDLVDEILPSIEALYLGLCRARGRGGS